MQNRNVRITYPDSPDGTLEVDLVEGMQVSLTLTLPMLRYYAKDGVVEVIQNRYAGPGYSNYLYSQTMRVSLSEGDESEEKVINTTSTPTGVED